MTPDFLSSWRLDFTPLAPIHIGSGQDLDPTSYVLDADALYEFSPNALAAVLDEADRNRLLGLVDGHGNNQALTQVRKFLFERREGLIAQASRAAHVASGVQALYEGRLGSSAQRETGAINGLEVERVFSHPDTRAPILPGSSLKGAIRTALLDRENGGQEPKDKETSSDDSRIQKKLFDYRSFDADPMRLVHVADAMTASVDATTELAQETAIVFAVNRKKRRLTKADGREIRTQAKQKGPYQTLEIVPALRWRAFQGGLTIHRTDLPDDERFRERLPKAKLRWSATDIAGACNRFYRRKFDSELRELRDRGLLDDRWHTAVKQLKERGLDELLDSNRAFLLRVGRHSGAESVTLDGRRSIRIKTPKDQKARWEKEATTWWLAADRLDASSDLLPFGWLLVEMTEGDGAPEPRAEIAETLDSFHCDSGEQEWRTRVLQRRDVLLKQQDAEAARQADNERRRREQEDARREREAKRASMTEEERSLDELQREFESSQRTGEFTKQGQGGKVPTKARDILQAAANWPAPFRTQAADSVEAVFKALRFPKGQKGRNLKDKISDLRKPTTEGNLEQ